MNMRDDDPDGSAPAGGSLDPGAAPGTSDAGSTGYLVGTGLAGAGTGTSIGPSRGNTGPGTGSDAAERAYGRESDTPLPDMLGLDTGREPDDATSGAALTPEERAARVAQAGTPGAQQALQAADPGNASVITSNRGLGDDDIPAETEVE